MNIKLDSIESLRCQVARVWTAQAFTDGEIQKVVKSAKRRKDAVQWSGDQLQELTAWQRELAEDLQAAYQDGLTYNLKLVALLRFAESLPMPIWDSLRGEWRSLQADALADIEQLRVAVERLSDPIEQQNHDGRAMKLDGKTWPDVTKSLGYPRDEWTTIRKRIVDWDKANGSLIPIGKPGRPKT